MHTGSCDSDQRVKPRIHHAQNRSLLPGSSFLEIFSGTQEAMHFLKFYSRRLFAAKQEKLPLTSKIPEKHAAGSVIVASEQ